MIGIIFSTVMRCYPIFGKYQIYYCLKCFDNKNVVVASSDTEIYSVVQGDIKTINRFKKICVGFLSDYLSGREMQIRDKV
jgi:hypothetical protein